MSEIAVRYERNSTGLQQLLETEEMAAAMVSVATTGLGYFETIAPRRTSRYATTAEVLADTDTTPTPRRVARLVARAPYAASVEAGNDQGARAQHILRTVADTLEGTT